MNNQIEQLRSYSLSLRKNEVWREVDFSDFLPQDMTPAQPIDGNLPTLHCNIPDLDTYRIALANGYPMADAMQLPEGVRIITMKKALQEMPEVMEKYMGKCAVGTMTRNFTTLKDKTSHKRLENPYLELNTRNYTDGLVVVIEPNIKVDKPIQILSVIQGQMAQLVQTRNLIVVGKHSEATFILCDDSLDQSTSFSNNATEVYADEDAKVALYKMQNLNNQSALLSQTFVVMQQNSTLSSMAITLNGGQIRNHTEVRMQGEGCDCQAHGLYLIDKEQQSDNYIYVEHAHPHCNSEELFKGILDDSARASFNGHVLVSDGAKKTEAYQTNKNILLTDKAHIDTKPFLEIYNDDVKCSHGSTIGQLDELALFYIRSRGISERTAKTMLLYAFCDEVIQKISLPALRDRLMDMVKKRLHGELQICSDCALHCSSPCNGEDAAKTFMIDTSLL